MPNRCLINKCLPSECATSAVHSPLHTAGNCLSLTILFSSLASGRIQLSTIEQLKILHTLEDICCGLCLEVHAILYILSMSNHFYFFFPFHVFHRLSASMTSGLTCLPHVVLICYMPKCRTDWLLNTSFFHLHYMDCSSPLCFLPPAY